MTINLRDFSKFFVVRDDGSGDAPEIPGKRGLVYTHSAQHLAALCWSVRISKRLEAMGLKRVQGVTGGEEQTFLLTVEQLRAVSPLLLLKRRRQVQMSPEQRKAVGKRLSASKQGMAGKAFPAQGVTIPAEQCPSPVATPNAVPGALNGL